MDATPPRETTPLFSAETGRKRGFSYSYYKTLEPSDGKAFLKLSSQLSNLSDIPPPIADHNGLEEQKIDEEVRIYAM